MTDAATPTVFRATVQRVAPDVERVSLRTPTLPPATETNTYLLTRGKALWVVEPATPYEPEREALFALVQERIDAGSVLLGALLTHHHGDHTGCADALRARFSVEVIAHERTREKLAGRVTVDRTLSDGDALFDGAVRVLHTPGHAPGHLCFFARDERWLIAGDMVASIGTILIDTDDDGDMAAYLAQLERLRSLSPRVLLPAHGDPIEDADARLAFYVSHRLAREARVVRALEAVAASIASPATLRAIVERAYDDTPPALWPLADRSARAHLAKLVAEHRAIEHAGERYSLP